MTTPKPIDQLTPEELRVECAESMGWTKGKSRLSVILECGIIKQWNPPKNYPWQYLTPNLPNYPADANAALTMAHALAEKGWECHTKLQNGVWQCFFLRGASQTRQATATGSHAFALAMCRAYLAVVRAGKEQQG